MKLNLLAFIFLFSGSLVPGLKLEPIQSVMAASEQQTGYTCPMHPEVHSEHPGNCPICHMKLKKITTQKSAPTSKSGSSKGRKIKFYRNPMNPSVTSKKPMKDEMGMDYIPVYEDESKSDESDQGSLGVPGRSSLKLNETQFQLSGVSLLKVERGRIESRIPISGRALSSSRASIQVAERDLPHVKLGMETELNAPAVGTQTIRGKITSLDSVLDPMTRSLRADVQLARPTQGLRAEASVAGDILILRPDTLIVPDSSVLFLDQIAYVYQVNSERTRLIPKQVQVGVKGEHQIEILSGLSEGDLISSGPNFLIDSESRIQSVHR